MAKANPKLDEELEKARHRQMTPTEREAQRRSFVYGNTKIEFDAVTKRIVDEAADEDDGDAE